LTFNSESDNDNSIPVHSDGTEPSGCSTDIDSELLNYSDQSTAYPAVGVEMKSVVCKNVHYTT